MLLTLPTVMKETALSRSSIYAAVKCGAFPAPLRIASAPSLADPNLRWCSDGFELTSDNGEKVRIVFALDCCDRCAPILPPTLIDDALDFVKCNTLHFSPVGELLCFLGGLRFSPACATVDAS